MKSLADFSLADITPEALTSDKTFSALIQAIDPYLRSLAEDTKHAGLLWRLDELDDSVLDLLMQQFHADFADLAQTHDMKLRTVKSSLAWHSRKGTASAIIEALKLIDIDAVFVPWWETGDPPYTFRLKAVVAGDFYRDAGRDRLMQSIIRAVNTAKSARSFMLGIETTIREKGTGNLFAGAYSLLSGRQELHPELPEPPGKILLPLSAASLLSGKMKIGIAGPDDASAKLFAGSFSCISYSLSIGVDSNTMVELLTRFENRIFDRIDKLERRLSEHIRIAQDQSFQGDYDLKAYIGIRIRELQDDIYSRLGRLEKMLRWRGDDEE